MSKSVLQSRPLPRPHADDFESLQLGEGLTFAEEALREVVQHLNGAEKVEWIRREIILPVHKARPKPLPSDHEGHILKGQLADAAAQRNWHDLSQRQRDAVYNAGSEAYLAENRDDVDSRTVFFKGTMASKSNGGRQLQKIAAVVKIFSLSGSWNLAEVRVWEITTYPDKNAPRQYRGGTFSVMATVSTIAPLKDSSPPAFLL